MPEIGTSGSMSGDGKRAIGKASSTAPILDSTCAEVIEDLSRLGPNPAVHSSVSFRLKDARQSARTTRQSRCAEVLRESLQAIVALSAEL
jgi:hypothetical protein